MIATTCSFCHRSYTLAEFLALPQAPGAIKQGIDRSYIGGGLACVIRDCDCLPAGRRNSLGAIVDSYGKLVPLHRSLAQSRSRGSAPAVHLDARRSFGALAPAPLPLRTRVWRSPWWWLGVGLGFAALMLAKGS